MMLSPFHFALVVLCACPFWAYARGVFLELSCAHCVLMAAPVQMMGEEEPVRERCRAPCRESEGRR